MSIDEIQKEIIKEFENFDNQIEKYNYLVKLGKNLSPIDPALKTEENTIKDCQVKTWFLNEFKDGKIFYYIGSKSLLTNGIISLLIRVFSGQKPKEIKDADLYFIKKIGLEDNFSFFRANSLGKLIERIKLEAKKYEK